MKFVRLILAITFGIFLGTSFAYADEPRYIQWSEDRKLVWDDFLGIPHEYPPTYERPDPDDIAFTWGPPRLLDFDHDTVNSNICQYQIVHVDAAGFFDKNQSWTTDEARADPDALNHEQGHFDIIEVFARKIESNLLFKIFECLNGSYDKRTIDNDIRNKVLDITKKNQEMHDDYDNETDDGGNSSKQYDWDLQISGDLNRLYHDKTDFSSETIPKFTFQINNKGIECTLGWKSVEKISNGKLVCVTPAVASALIDRGWGKIFGSGEY